VIKLAVICFLVAHGFIHTALYNIKPDPKSPQPFNPGESWMLRRLDVNAAMAKQASAVLSATTSLLFVLAALGLLLGAGWWPAATIVAVGVAAALKVAYFHAWLTIGVLIDVAIVVALAAHWPAVLF